MSLTEIQTPHPGNMINTTEAPAPSELEIQSGALGEVRTIGTAALTQVELPAEAHQLVQENVNPDQHILTALKDRFKNRFIKRRMGQIEKELNKEHMELAEKQKVRPSVLQRDLLETQAITSNPSDLPQRASVARREVFAEEPDQFDQRLQKANQMLARPQVSGAKKPVQAQSGPFRFDRQN